MHGTFRKAKSSLELGEKEMKEIWMYQRTGNSENIFQKRPRRRKKHTDPREGKIACENYPGFLISCWYLTWNKVSIDNGLPQTRSPDLNEERSRRCRWKQKFGKHVRKQKGIITINAVRRMPWYEVRNFEQILNIYK